MKSIFYGPMRINNNEDANIITCISRIPISKCWNIFPLIMEGDSNLIISLATRLQNSTPASKMDLGWKIYILLQVLTEELKNTSLIIF